MATDRARRVLTAVGSDRPGLVSEISRRLREQGANIEDSRMAVLGGEFALMLLLSSPPERAGGLGPACEAIGLELGLRTSLVDTTPRAAAEASRYRLSVTGLDHPGIVEGVSRALADHAINVTSMETRLVHAPLTGTPTFLLSADVDVPLAADLDSVREAIAQACAHADVDHVFERAD